MSFEQDIVNLSDAAGKVYESGLTCTDTQFENGERLVLQKGFGEIVKNTLLNLKNVRLKDQLNDFKEKILELETRREASTINPGEE